MRRRLALLVAAAAIGLASCDSIGYSRTPPITATVTLDATTRHQTITGWEAESQSGQRTSGFPLYRDSLFRLAINDLGITRVRLSVRSGAENPEYSEEACQRFVTINDNDDPFEIDWDGFNFTELDIKIDNVVVPLMREAEKAGEKLFINLTYVSFIGHCPPGTPYHHTDPEEYAELILATTLHMRDKYGLVPDAWEVILEPENTAGHWTGERIGHAIVATARRLEEAGFTPRFIAPSNTKVANAIRYFDEMIEVPGVLPYLEEFSYHRYRGVKPGEIEAIAERARRYGLKTSMLEHIGSGHEDLHEDLKVGMNSAWEQFTLAFNTRRGKDNGAQYYVIERADSRRPKIRMGDRTRYLRQYFRYIRPGAVRIEATSDRSEFDPLAFVDSAGRHVVVVKASARGTIRIAALPAGTYAGRYTTARDTHEATGDVALEAGEILRVEMPAAGVLTVFQK